jgi:hypothetical protein
VLFEFSILLAGLIGRPSSTAAPATAPEGTGQATGG